MDSVETKGAVFVMTNTDINNQVTMYRRSTSGQLSLVGKFATGGRGSSGVGDPLHSQDTMVLTPDHRLLLAVNPGSSDISVFRVTNKGLELLSVTPVRGGAAPISLALHDNLVYALNYVGNYHLVGFTLNPSTGTLRPIPSSITPLSPSPDNDPADISFTPNGKKLVVTERFTNLIDVFDVGVDGSLSHPVFNKSLGIEPFSFLITPQGVLVVSETNRPSPTNPRPGLVSTYKINSDNTLSAISRSVSTSGLAPCWIAANSEYAWLANTLTGNIGAVSIESNGTLAPLGSVAKPASTAFPTDLAVTPDGKFLYALFNGIGQLIGYKVGNNGQLTGVTTVSPTLPNQGAVGVVAY